MRFLLPLLAFSVGSLLFLSACSSETEVPENLVEAVQQHHANNEFEQAFELLRNTNEEEPYFKDLVFATHMNYALYLTYEAETVTMTERMPNALRHFRRVLELDPDNDRVKAEIALIEGIYQQMGRPIPEGVAEL